METRRNLVRLGLALALFALLTTLAPVVAASPQSVTQVVSSWTGEYFKNMTLSGLPVLVRDDPNLDFTWAQGTSPAPAVANTEHYSIRWTRSVYLDTSGNWIFSTVNDDGMRVWVDGAITVDAWYDQAPTAHTGTIYLNAGWHTLRVEYYNNTLGGTARVSYSLPGSYPNWKGEYYGNQILSGTPAVTRNDVSVNFNWGLAAPDASLPADHFSIRWTRTLYFAAGNWRFTTRTDDGVRLWVDGSPLIDKWVNQSATSHSADMALAAGDHTVKMEYFENGWDAVAQLSYSPVTTPSGAWHGQYFNNVSLSGAPVFTRDDSALNFNWGAGSPDPSVPVDNFSAKWDSAQSLSSSGNYTIGATSDDGVRVWVDGTLVVDAWNDHSPTTFTATRYLTAGTHNFHVEYYEHRVGAMITVQVAAGSAPPGDVIVDDRGPGWLAGGSATGWHSSSAGIGGHSFWTYNNSYAAPMYDWARWIPTLPGAGNYEVLAYIPGGLATTTNARYWVYHNNSYVSIARSQGFYSNQWISLGTYYFAANGTEYASLSDVTFECYLCRTVAFDAVKFSPR